MKINKSGLSGIKIITVLAITSLWVSIALPTLFHFNIEANEAQALNQMQKLTDACEKFKAQYGKYPQNLQALSKMIKEGLTSPGYHFQYEFLSEGNFVLVALPNNNFTGQNGYYSDNENQPIIVPEVTHGRNRGEGKPMIIDETPEKRIIRKIKDKGKVETAYSVISRANNISLMGGNQLKIQGKVDTKSEFMNVIKTYMQAQPSVYPGNILPELPKSKSPEPPKEIVLSGLPKLSLPEIDHGFADLVEALESISSTPVNSIALAKSDTRTSEILVARNNRPDELSSLVAKTRDISLARDTAVVGALVQNTAVVGAIVKDTTVVIEKTKPNDDVVINKPQEADTTGAEGSSAREKIPRSR